MAYTRAGLTPDGSSTYFLPRIIGYRRTLELAITNRVLSAREAAEMGLVTRVVPDADLIAEATKFATQLAAGPTVAYGGDVLSVPGHPDVPLEAIRQMDKSRWDRKGIAKVEYELAPGQSNRLTLDDFIYDRPPTDRIVERIEAHLARSAPRSGEDVQPRV